MKLYLCNPFAGEHTWVWASGDTVGEPFVGQLCTCGAYKHTGRGVPAVPADDTEHDIENAAALEFEEQE